MPGSRDPSENVRAGAPDRARISTMRPFSNRVSFVNNFSAAARQLEPELWNFEIEVRKA